MHRFDRSAQAGAIGRDAWHQLRVILPRYRLTSAPGELTVLHACVWTLDCLGRRMAPGSLSGVTAPPPESSGLPFNPTLYVDSHDYQEAL
jgi:hypothetical protein